MGGIVLGAAEIGSRTTTAAGFQLVLRLALRPVTWFDHGRWPWACAG